MPPVPVAVVACASLYVAHQEGLLSVKKTVAMGYVPLVVVLKRLEAMLEEAGFEVAAVSTVVADSMSWWMAHGEEDWSVAVVVNGHVL
nr:unnamed protein product [Digitaria exilis]